jgi:hypothetical protein
MSSNPNKQRFTIRQLLGFTTVAAVIAGLLLHFKLGLGVGALIFLFTTVNALAIGYFVIALFRRES